MVVKFMNNKADNLKKIESYSFNCIFGKNIIFIIFRDLINIGHLDNNNIFKTEMIIKMKESNHFNLKVIMDKIRTYEFDGFKTILFFGICK